MKNRLPKLSGHGPGEDRASKAQRVSAAGRSLPDEALEGFAGPTPQITLDGIEVTQAIQNMNHDVPLIAGKTTIVRVYLSTDVTFPVTVRGTLLIRNPAGTGQWRSLMPVGTTTLDPNDNGNLRRKREDMARSLNFRLPEDVVQAGQCEIRLGSLVILDPLGEVAVPDDAQQTVEFLESPPLRLNVVGIRFRDSLGAGPFEPAAADFALLRSWLERAYPVARVDWSQVVVDAPQPWPFDAIRVNLFLRGIRNQDVASGLDRRTHYYGMVADGGGSFFMRGRASGIPLVADPSAVACGPAGAFGFAWDTDGSYGDWYGAHELGHTFGRFHAQFCGASGGAIYPFQNGRLSDSDGAFAGCDVGDVNQAIAMQALPGVQWHDVMTYCDNQWISSFTYMGIRQRLLQEDSLPAGVAMPAGAGAMSPVAAGANPNGPEMGVLGYVHVLAAINLTRGTGRIEYVTAHPGLAPAAVAGEEETVAGDDMPSPSVRLLAEDGAFLNEYPVPYYPDACADPEDDETGIVDAAIPNLPFASSLELLLNGEVVDIYTSTVHAAPVTDIHVEPPAGEEGVSPLPSPPVITWHDPAVSAEESLAGEGETARGSTPVYSAQISTDGGINWRTIGFGLTRPQVSVDPELLAGVDTVQIRIISTDGFHSESSVVEMPVEDLL